MADVVPLQHGYRGSPGGPRAVAPAADRRRGAFSPPRPPRAQRVAPYADREWLRPNWRYQTFACCYPIPRTLDAAATSVPIGRPISNTQVYVLASDLQPVPLGTIGQLYIAGDGLARGYLHAADLTRDAFLRHPFSDDPDERIYKTGDRVRYLPDGNLEFHGRLDDQVKIRGFRVELAEVEAALAAHPLVKTAAVVACRSERDTALVGYAVPRDAPLPSPPELREFLRERLPDRLIPRSVVALNAMPMLSTGKVDRLVLSTRHPPATRLPHGGIAGGSLLEYQIAKIWKEVLDTNEVGIHDDFFDLGGHSLLAVRVINQIATNLRKEAATVGHVHEPDGGTPGRPAAAAASRRRVDLVRLGAGTHPFFFLHGDLRGGGYYCLQLAQRLGQAGPLIPVQPLGLDGAAVPSTIEALAAIHLQRIRAMQQHGPYRLGGYCHGGLIAFEMARQLEAQGESVESLVVLDASGANPFRWLNEQLRRAARALGVDPEREWRWFLLLRTCCLLIQKGAIAYRQLPLRAWLRVAARRRHEAAHRFRTPFLTQSPTSHEGSDSSGEIVRRAYLQAQTRYVRRKYGGKMVLLRSEETFSAAAVQDPTLGWRDVVADVETHTVLAATIPV